MADHNDLVFINLDRPRFLWCGNKALKTMTALLGKPVSELETSNFDPDEIEKIMYALLMKDAAQNGETLTLEKASDLLDEVAYGNVIKAMGEAFQAAFDTGKNAQRAAVNGTGKKA